MIDESTRDSVLGPVQTEKDLFEELNDSILKTNKKMFCSKIKENVKKYKSKKSSSKDDILNGLNDLNDSDSDE